MNRGAPLGRDILSPGQQGGPVFLGEGCRRFRLQALAPWPDFKSEEFAQGLFHAKAQGEKTEAEWRKTMETLERAAGAPRVKEAPPEIPSR